MKLDTSNWDKVSFGEVARSVNLATRNPLAEGLTRYVALEHIEPENIHTKSWGDVVSGTTFTRIFRKGQVLFGKRRAYQKKAAFAEFDGVCSGDILVLESVKSRLLPELLPFIVHSDSFFAHAVKTSAGSLSPRTKYKDLAAFPLKLPPIHEQRRLSNLLWSIDLTTERYSETVLCLEKLKQSLEWNFFRTNKSWPTRKVEDIAQVDYGISEAVADNKDSAIGWPILTGANITLEGGIDLSKQVYIEPPQKEQFFLQKGDLLLNWRSGSPAHVGKTALFNLDGNFTYASFILRIRAKQELFLPTYGHYLFNFLRRIEYFTKDVAQQVNFKMNANVFRTVKIPVPTLEEQKVIVAELDEVIKQKAQVEALIAETAEIKRQIINQIL